jgi:hypothetical protein
VLAADEHLKIIEESQLTVSMLEADSNPWLVLTEEPKKSTLPYDAWPICPLGFEQWKHVS